jgi:hypothetical protein
LKVRRGYNDGTAHDTYNAAHDSNNANDAAHDSSNGTVNVRTCRYETVCNTDCKSTYNNGGERSCNASGHKQPDGTTSNTADANMPELLQPTLSPRRPQR